ncbi:chaperone protein DnaJ, partial [Perkinsela sp. CCAP 1560/4]
MNCLSLDEALTTNLQWKNSSAKTKICMKFSASRNGPVRRIKPSRSKTSPRHIENPPSIATPTKPKRRTISKSFTRLVPPTPCSSWPPRARPMTRRARSMWRISRSRHARRTGRTYFVPCMMRSRSLKSSHSTQRTQAPRKKSKIWSKGTQRPRGILPSLCSAMLSSTTQRKAMSLESSASSKNSSKIRHL